MATIDPTKAHLLHDFKHKRPLIGCCFDPQSRFLFVSSEDDSLQRFELATGKVQPFVGHKSWVRGMACTPAKSGFTLISGDYHGKLLWWNGADEKPKPVREVAAHDGWIRAVAISPDGKTVASCGNDHLVKLWSVADGRLLQTLIGHECHVYNIAIHPDGKRLASSDLLGGLYEWDLATGKILRKLETKALHKFDTSFVADIGGARGMAFDRTGTALACIGISNVSNAFAGVGNPLVLLFDWNKGTSKPFPPKDKVQATGWAVRMHDQGYVIGAGGAGDGRIWIWKQADGTNIHTIKVKNNCRDMALSPNGEFVAIAGSRGDATVYSLVPKAA